MPSTRSRSGLIPAPKQAAKKDERKGKTGTKEEGRRGTRQDVGNGPSSSRQASVTESVPLTRARNRHASAAVEPDQPKIKRGKPSTISQLNDGKAKETVKEIPTRVLRAKTSANAVRTDNQSSAPPSQGNAAPPQRTVRVATVTGRDLRAGISFPFLALNRLTTDQIAQVRTIGSTANTRGDERPPKSGFRTSSKSNAEEAPAASVRTTRNQARALGAAQRQ